MNQSMKMNGKVADIPSEVQRLRYVYEHKKKTRWTKQHRINLIAIEVFELKKKRNTLTRLMEKTVQTFSAFFFINKNQNKVAAIETSK